MQICIDEIKKHLEQQDFYKNIDLFKAFYKSILFKSIEKIIIDYNYNYGNKYFENDFDDYIFTKKTILKYEKEVIAILNFIFFNYGDGFFIAKKNENNLFFTNKNQFCINGYENFNSKLKYETTLTIA